MHIFKRSVPALPEILQAFPSDGSVFGVFPAPCEGEYPLATREKGKELLSYVPYYANHPLVQEAVRELEKLEEQQKRQKKQSMER